MFNICFGLFNEVILLYHRSLLDFDFEKLCTVSLSHLNVYACLVCGKYFQGDLQLTSMLIAAEGFCYLCIYHYSTQCRFYFWKAPDKASLIIC